MSSDEEDYMSDKYLARGSEDIRPGLPKRKTDQYVFERYKKKLKADEEKQEVKEENVRDKGLNTALSADNKGFQMLAKMGYKTGSSLGSQNKGIVEPISINIRDAKAGLGAKEKRKTKQSPTKKMTNAQLKAMEATFRKTVQDKKNLEMIKRYYRKAQSSCLNLDQQNNIDFPNHEFYWPASVIAEMKAKQKKLQDAEESDEEEEEENEDKNTFSEELLDEIVNYLRHTYFYCIYCTAKATDEEDLNSFCPGASYVDHEDE